MADVNGGLKGMFARCSAATNTSEVWAASGVVFLALGIMGYSVAFFVIGAAFLAIALTRRRGSVR